jgi:DnaK suppressor protein
MEPNRMMFFRTILQQKIVELINGQAKTISSMSSDNERIVDTNDQASVEVEKNFEFRIRDRERRLIVKMRDAIQRIDDGTFGTCSDCGEEISEKRLMARPVTTQCLACKTKEEKIEKLMGVKDVRFVQYGFQGSSQSRQED